MIAYMSWCNYCSREYSDHRWIEVEGNIMTCRKCKKTSEIKTDENDEAFFYLKRLNNGK